MTIDHTATLTLQEIKEAISKYVLNTWDAVERKLVVDEVIIEHNKSKLNGEETITTVAIVRFK